VVVDCSGLSETLFESELFGHEKGAFTGAGARKPGLVETAHGGTLFLDEIGDVPLSMQVKLLRLIETGTYRRVGGVETLRADFRLVAATHKRLADMVERGEFRQDLYYRISVFPLNLPPLRERREDIPLLADSMLEHGGGMRLSIEPAAMRALLAYPWPGNVRELRNVLERARLFADDGVIRADYLALPCPTPANPAPRLPTPDQLARSVAGFKGTRRELAAQLGISERTLYRRLKELGLA
jgi:transcriptional regulator with PAS, ATPase and Fis domain